MGSPPVPLHIQPRLGLLPGVVHEDEEERTWQAAGQLGPTARLAGGEQLAAEVALVGVVSVGSTSAGPVAPVVVPKYGYFDSEKQKFAAVVESQ